MASGTHHCQDCGLYFDSAQSLDVHLQYHKENLMSMWMGSDEIKREPNAESRGSDLVQMNARSAPISTASVSTGLSNMYVKSEPKDNRETEPEPSFIGPPPISPMDYDFKAEVPLQSPRNNLISPGPSSGSALPSYSQSSTYYQDFNQQALSQQQQHSFGSFSSNYMNGYDDQFYNRGSNTTRFHPYIGRSPIPTPSPGAISEVKDERLTPGTPEILDLDSQKVLNVNPNQQSTQLGSLPPMWRPHEPFPSTQSSTSCGPSVGLGVPSPTGVKPLIPPLGPSPTNIATPVGLGLSTGMNMNSTGPPGQLTMPPPMQQNFGNQHSIGSQNHQLISPGSNVAGFSSGSTLPTFYPQTHPVSSTLPNNPSVQFVSNQTSSPTPRDVPAPSEYPSNVKRAKSFKCEDCNKWFTSHGHLKRHYNTTLHKNMTKLNSANSGASTPSNNQDTSRTPLVSPSSNSIGESSNTSSHEEDSAPVQAPKAADTAINFPPTASAFQPPPTNIGSYPTQNIIYPGHTTVAIGHHNPPLPHYTQAHSFPPEQPLTAPTMYHGHFSTNPASYAPQPPVPGSGSQFFLANNYFYPQQGGLHGPGFHSMNEFSGPNPVDGFNSYRHENNGHHSPHSNGLDSRISPEPAGDTGSEASMDSSESCNSISAPAESNYKCNDCNKTFNRMCYLTQHRSTYHDGEKPFKCSTCGKRFTDETTYTDHQGKHAGEKPYKCEICPKQFNHKTDLRRHMCLHTGEKPFSCDHCGKGFIRKDHMLKHFQTHKKKALQAAANTVPSHPSMPPSFTSHHGLPPTHGPLPHPPHGPRGHPHIVAPTVY